MSNSSDREASTKMSLLKRGSLNLRTFHVEEGSIYFLELLRSDRIIRLRTKFINTINKSVKINSLATI
jgi:hypothetical protein